MNVLWTLTLGQRSEPVPTGPDMVSVHYFPSTTGRWTVGTTQDRLSRVVNTRIPEPQVRVETVNDRYGETLLTG